MSLNFAYFVNWAIPERFFFHIFEFKRQHQFYCFVIIKSYSWWQNISAVTVFSCNFDSPQEKGSLTSSVINFVYELPHELLNVLLKLLNVWILIQMGIQINAQSPHQKQIIGNNGQNLGKSRYLVLFNFPWYSYFLSNIFSPIVVIK